MIDLFYLTYLENEAFHSDDKKIGKKKLAKLHAKAEAKCQREAVS